MDPEFFKELYQLDISVLAFLFQLKNPHPISHVEQKVQKPLIKTPTDDQRNLMLGMLKQVASIYKPFFKLATTEVQSVQDW